jgi:hypothetical protein
MIAPTVLFGPIEPIKPASNIDIKKGIGLRVYVADEISLPQRIRPSSYITCISTAPL